jgi:hypothetical protein
MCDMTHQLVLDVVVVDQALPEAVKLFRRQLKNVIIEAVY